MNNFFSYSVFYTETSPLLFVLLHAYCNIQGWTPRFNMIESCQSQFLYGDVTLIGIPDALYQLIVQVITRQLWHKRVDLMYVFGSLYGVLKTILWRRVSTSDVFIDTNTRSVLNGHVRSYWSVMVWNTHFSIVQCFL